MSLSTFLRFVELQTKVASLFPFLVGLLFVIYRFESFNLLNTVIFFFAMLIFDLTTTGINNYMDYKKAHSDEYRKTENIIGQANIPAGLAKNTILTMLFIAMGLGIWLVFRNRFISTVHWDSLLYYWCFLYVWTSPYFSNSFWRDFFRCNNGIRDFIPYRLCKCL